MPSTTCQTNAATGDNWQPSVTKQQGNSSCHKGAQLACFGQHCRLLSYFSSKYRIQSPLSYCYQTYRNPGWPMDLHERSAQRISSIERANKHFQSVTGLAACRQSLTQESCPSRNVCLGCHKIHVAIIYTSASLVLYIAFV